MAVKPFQTATVTTVAVSTTSATLLAAGVGLNFRAVSNTSGQVLYVRFGTGAAVSTDHTVAVASGGYYEFPQPLYTGAVTAIMGGGTTGNVLVTTY